MNYDAMLEQLLQKKYEAPSLGPTTGIQAPDFRSQSASSGGQIDPKVAGALANMIKGSGEAIPMKPIGEAGGKPVFNVPVDPVKGRYLPGGASETAQSAGIQQEQPGSEEWVRKIMAGVGM